MDVNMDKQFFMGSNLNNQDGQLRVVQSPIEGRNTDGMENFDSEMISEDDTSEILAQLSKEVNDF